MDDLRTRALLVGFDPARAGTGSIGTYVSRAEVAETAARGEFPATMLLDLDRVETADGGEVTAHARLAVEWDKGTLEQLLASTEDTDIALWFDEAGLARAFDDVEAHGLRERAAVFAIAVTAAGVTAAPSLASTYGGSEGGGGGGAVVQAMVDQNIGLKQAPQVAAQQAPQVDQNVGLKQAPQVAAQQAPQVDQNVGLKQVPIGGAERALQMEDRNIGLKQPAGSIGGTSVTSTGDTGLSAGELAGIAGAGAALLISAAGFGMARKRQPPVLPA
jgi:hypothetical protein